MSERDPYGKDAHSPGSKLDAGKLLGGILDDFALALTEVAKVGTFGARKYTRGGWLEVPDGVTRYGDAAWRHRLKGASGEDKDGESDLLHEAHECWNRLAVLELRLRSERAQREMVRPEAVLSTAQRRIASLHVLIEQRDREGARLLAAAMAEELRGVALFLAGESNAK